MTDEQKAQLAAIKPGETYPGYVIIKEKDDAGDDFKIKFLLQSYIVGMYCAIHVNGSSMPTQTGDTNNTTFVRKLKKDIRKAIKRGSDVEIGSIVNVQPMEPV